MVDDIPRPPGRFCRYLPDPRFFNAVRQIYAAPNIRMFRRYGQSSNTATLAAVRHAQSVGADLVFVHLDDQTYVHEFGKLLPFAIHAFREMPKLKCVHLSGYPLIDKNCTVELDNHTHIAISEDEITFDCVRLLPFRFSNYSLWATDMNEELVRGQYWPIALWLAIYRVDFLEALLTHREVTALKTLGNVETYYRQEENLRQFLALYGGQIGYINMQFGGFEMHRNPDWRKLVELPNEPIL